MYPAPTLGFLNLARFRLFRRTPEPVPIPESVLATESLVAEGSPQIEFPVSLKDFHLSFDSRGIVLTNDRGQNIKLEFGKGLRTVTEFKGSTMTIRAEAADWRASLPRV